MVIHAFVMEEMANKVYYQLWHKFAVVLAKFFPAFRIKLSIRENEVREDVLSILRTTYHFDLTNLQ